MALRIGDLARRAGVSAPAIRYYEDIGLLRPPTRQASGQRVYDASDVVRLTFIRRCRALGFSIDQTRMLVSVRQDPRSSCMTARDLAAAQCQSIRAKMRELEALEQCLAQFVRDCDETCGGRPGPECTVLRGLGTESSGGAGLEPRA